MCHLAKKCARQVNEAIFPDTFQAQISLEMKIFFVSNISAFIFSLLNWQGNSLPHLRASLTMWLSAGSAFMVVYHMSRR